MHLSCGNCSRAGGMRFALTKKVMANKIKSKRSWAGVPPWIFMGAVVVLFPIFAFMTLQNITR